MVICKKKKRKSDFYYALCILMAFVGATVGEITSCSECDYRFVEVLGDVMGGDLDFNSSNDLLGVSTTHTVDMVFDVNDSEVSPDSLDNLMLWVDASTIDPSNSSQVVGGSVIRIVDLANGIVFNMTDNNSTWPAYSATGLNGRPTIVFDGVDDFLVANRTSNFSVSAPLTVFAVFNPSVLGNNQLLTYGPPSTLTGFVVGSNLDTLKFSTLGRQNFYSSSWLTAGVDVIVGYSYEHYDSNYLVSFYGNGSFLSDSVGAYDVPSPTVGNLYFGRYPGAGPYFWKGEASELIIFNDSLSYDERKKVEAYLSNKYDLPIQRLPNKVYGGDLDFEVDSLSTSNLHTVDLTFDVNDSFVEPDSLDGLTLWVDASTIDPSNSSQVVGGYVRMVTDRSENHHIFEQYTNSTNRPLYSANGLNGMPSMVFDGVNDFLNSSYDSSFTKNAPMTIFTVVDTDTVSGFHGSFGQDPTVPSSSGYSTGSYNDRSRFTTAGIKDYLSSAYLSVNTGYILEYYFDSGYDTSFYSDGVFINTDAGASDVASGTGDFYIGAIFQISSQLITIPWDGEISEVIVYNRTLSYDERKKVEAYLADKYSIPIELPPNNVVSDDVLFFDVGSVEIPSAYSTAVGGTYRDLYVDDDGVIGYLPSKKKTKTKVKNITSNDTGILYDLEPKSYNYLSQCFEYSNCNGTMFDCDFFYNCSDSPLTYGLVVEDVYNVSADLVSLTNGSPESVDYDKIVALLVSEIQDMRIELDDLKKKVKD